MVYTTLLLHPGTTLHLLKSRVHAIRNIEDWQDMQAPQNLDSMANSDVENKQGLFDIDNVDLELTCMRTLT